MQVKKENLQSFKYVLLDAADGDDAVTWLGTLFYNLDCYKRALEDEAMEGKAASEENIEGFETSFALAQDYFKARLGLKLEC
jgi:hypothetical protein